MSRGEVASSQHNKGWLKQGLDRFNELFDIVEKDRATTHAKQFEEAFRKWGKDNAAGSNKRKSLDVLYESIELHHELWSDNKDEMAENLGNGNMQSKKRKLCNNNVAGFPKVDIPSNSTIKTSSEEEDGSSDKGVENTNDDEMSETEAFLPEDDGPVKNSRA